MKRLIPLLVMVLAVTAFASVAQAAPARTPHATSENTSYLTFDASSLLAMPTHLHLKEVDGAHQIEMRDDRLYIGGLSLPILATFLALWIGRRADASLGTCLCFIIAPLLGFGGSHFISHVLGSTSYGIVLSGLIGLAAGIMLKQSTSTTVLLGLLTGAFVGIIGSFTFGSVYAALYYVLFLLAAGLLSLFLVFVVQAILEVRRQCFCTQQES